MAELGERESMAGQAVSESELVALLDRLAQEELGGEPMPTLAEVSEATGAPVEVLARMLSDIRRVPELELRLQKSEAKIAEVHGALSNTATEKSDLSFEQFKEFRRRDKDGELRLSVVVIGLFMLVIMFIGVLSVTNIGPPSVSRVSIHR